MMKVLFISNTNPYSKKFGAEQRSNMILNALKLGNIDVDIAYVGIQTSEEPKDIDSDTVVFWNTRGLLEVGFPHNLLRLLAVRFFPRCKNLANPIKEIIEKNNYDAIICRYLPFFYACGLEHYSNKLILDFDDEPVDSLKAFMNKNCDVIHRIYHKLILYSAKKQTEWAVKNIAVCCLANMADSIKYRVNCLPNISAYNVDKVQYLENCHNVLFIGKLDYTPNKEGLIRFLENVWPKVYRDFPFARLYIAGVGLEPSFKSFIEKFEGARAIGFVDDIYEFYSQGNIVVCPIYTGSGTNIKCMESLSMGKATVMTSFSSKGLSDKLKTSKNCVITDSDELMHKELVRLLSDKNYCSMLQENGLTLAKELYTLKSVSILLSKLLNDICKE